MTKFYNLSNHPSGKWGGEQLRAASVYGEVTDLPFPNVPEDMDEAGIAFLADTVAGEVDDGSVVHVMGEMTLTYAVIQRLKWRGIKCVASTTKREVTELPDGTKQIKFNFCKFREYA